MKLSEDQQKYGIEKVEKLAKELNLSFDQTIHIIENTQKIKEVWGWVNMGRFLMERANRKSNFKTGPEDEVH